MFGASASFPFTNSFGFGQPGLGAQHSTTLSLAELLGIDGLLYTSIASKPDRITGSGRRDMSVYPQNMRVALVSVRASDGWQEGLLDIQESYFTDFVYCRFFDPSLKDTFVSKYRAHFQLGCPPVGPFNIFNGAPKASGRTAASTTGGLREVPPRGFGDLLDFVPVPGLGADRKHGDIN